MGVRGKRSAVSLTVAPPSPALGRMPEPPAYLTPEQDSVWREVIASRAVDLGDKIAAQLDAFDPAWIADDDGLKRWDRLQAMAARNQGVVATLATKLRLATSSSVRAENAGTVMKKGAKLKPWEVS